MGLTKDLPASSQHEITLVFEKAGQVTLTATAKLPTEIKMTMPSHEASHDHNIPKTSQ
jgi:copper(I)-binding protein